jgi:hydrophobic/amphiphilic exporter-1 (mainly G- bacteria), HAE1 family
MSIYSTAVKKPITTIVIFIAVLVMGGYSLRQIPVDFYPEFDFPVISLFTSYPGASAADIEANVTRPFEDNLSTINNLKRMTSTSRDNISTISLEFEYGTNLDEATNEIRDVSGRLMRWLPEGVEQPFIFRFSANMIPVMMVTVTAQESYPALRKILDQGLINPLNRIDGVGNVLLLGGPEREIQVNVDPRQMQAYNISIEQLGGILAAENINMPSGNVKLGMIDYPLRFTGEFASSDRISNIVIGNFNGNPVFVRDVAEVKDTVKEATIDERIDGVQGLRIMIQKQSGANTVKVAEDVNKAMAELIKTMPPDIKIDKIFDTSDYIKSSIGNLVQILYYAAIFVVLVVLFFIGRWRATFIIFLTIPVSLITAFIYLYFSGNSINMISLSSLAIAMGMVVDDAIVVLENINRHIEKGSTGRESAIYGTNEVGLAVVASTLTVVAVFLPMTMISGMMGMFFNQLGWIVAITVTVSTIAALSLTPMLASKFLSQAKAKRTGLGPKLSNFIDKTLKGIDNFYSSVINTGLKHKWKVVFVSIGIFIASLTLIPMIGTGFFPETDESRITATIELPTGIRLDETLKTARAIEDVIQQKYSEVVIMGTSSGSSSTSAFGAPNAGTHTIQFFLRLVTPDKRERTVWELAELVRQDLEMFPEIVNYTVLTGDGGFGGTAPIAVEIYGEDFDETTTFALALAERMKQIPGTRDVDLSRGPEKPELRIIPDQEKMAMFGLNTHHVSRDVRNRIEGFTATRFREEGEEYDVVVRHREEFRNDLAEIENISVRNPMGTLVSLREFASIEEFFSPPNIERKNRQRYLTVNSQLYGRSLGKVSADIRAAIDEMEVPQNISISFGGQVQEQAEAFADLGLLLLLSIFLVYVVMAAQFESFSMPLIIMAAVPFSFTGVFIGLLLSGMELNVISFLGAIILIGIVVKNSIVFIDYANIMVSRGKSVVTAVKLACRSRLRPVLMTTLTTVLAMLPLAFSTAEGSEIWRPMGMAVIGGLSFSTLVTLVFVPVVYTLMGRRRVRKARRRLHGELQAVAIVK